MDDDTFRRPCRHLPDQVNLSASFLEFLYAGCVQDHQSQGQEGGDGLRQLWRVRLRLLRGGRCSSSLRLLRPQHLESEAALSPELWIQQLQAGIYILRLIFLFDKN